MDMTFGFSRQKQDVLGPGLQRRQLSASKRSAFPARTTRASAISATPAIPVSSTTRALQPARQPRRLEPDLPRRADVLDRHEHHEGQGPARLARRLLRELPVPGPLAAGNRQPARAVHLQCEHHGAARRPDRTTSTIVCGVSDRSRRQRQQERAERADDGARVAARTVLPRPVERRPRS